MSEKDSKVEKYLLIDGHSLAYRAFYALPVENFTASTGQSTNAIYGFASMLINLLQSERPDHVIASFDLSRKTFRSEKFPEYKANRASTPEELRSQFPLLEELLAAFNIAIVSREGYEADDLIATLTEEILNSRKNAKVFITTGDRDSFQLVNDQTTVLYPRKGVTDLARMTPTSIEEKYGITPNQYPDFAALRGDPSDNLPSIPGIGEKTATKLIQEFGSLSGLIAGADKVGGKVGESLRSHLAQLSLNRELTELIRQVPFDGAKLVELLTPHWPGVDEVALNKLFSQLEIKTLRERIAKLPRSSGFEESRTEPSVGQDLSKNLTALQLTSQEVASKMGELNEKEFALYWDLDEVNNLWRFAIALHDGETFWWQESEIPGWLINAKAEWALIAHGAKNLLRAAFNQGDLLAFKNAKIVFDTELAAYLLNPGSRNLSLEELIEDEFGPATNSLPSEEAIDLFSAQPFRPQMAEQLWHLRDRFSLTLRERNLFELLLEMELPVTRVLAKLESVGIGFNKALAVQIRQEFSHEYESELKNAFKIAGHEFNVNSPKQLQGVLFDELKLPKTKRIKTGFSTDADSLTWLLQETNNPILVSLLRIREIGKLQSVLDGLIESERSGRIHTTFQQTVTATGRLSSTEPNLQNIPVRTEAGRRIRDCFQAQPPFESILTADYSQIEMRIMAHLSADQHLLEAFHSGEDLHSTVASQVFGIAAKDVTAEMRRTIKAMSYGLAYGLSAFGLAAQLDLSPSEASKLMENYFQRFGGIREYLQGVVVEARKKGYTETLLGRRRYLPDLNSENRQRREMAERMALNAPIQGSAADIIKNAMLAIDQKMEQAAMSSRCLLQVHDELIFEVAPGEREDLERLIRKEMAGAYPLAAPLEVNIGVGKSWDEAAH